MAHTPCVGWYAASDEPSERQKVLDFLDSLTIGKNLVPELLAEAKELEKYAAAEAGNLAEKSRHLHNALSAKERSERLVEELRRALSEGKPGAEEEWERWFHAAAIGWVA